MNTVKKKFKIEGAHCSSCFIVIEMNLEELEGVKFVHSSYVKGVAEVEFDPRKISDDEIIKIISDLGYRASFFDI